MWGPPPVPRPAGWAPPTPTAELISTAAQRYRLGHHFDIVEYNHGSERSDLPVFTSRAGVITFDTAADKGGACQRVEVPGVPGAFLLVNALTPRECEQLLGVSEAMGYTEDAAVSLGRDVRHNETCAWIADDATIQGHIFERVKHLLPAEVGGGAVAGLNQRWRLYKYGEQDIFRPHTDGAWSGSAVVNGRLQQDAFGDRYSQLTFLIYLNDDFEGGATTFFLSEDTQCDVTGGSRGGSGGGRKKVSRGVKVAQGSVLCFFHGQHPLSPLHEGSLVTSGTKYVARSDVLYML